MMGYVDDIHNKLRLMHDHRLHEDFYRLTDFIISTGQLDQLPYLANIINTYDHECRKCFWQSQTIDDLREKLESRRYAK